MKTRDKVLLTILTLVFGPSPSVADTPACLSLLSISKHKAISPQTLNIYTTKQSGLAARKHIEQVLSRIRLPRLTDPDSIAGRELMREEKSPIGPLIPIEMRRASESHPGKFYRDQSGEIYLLKSDLKYKELQTGAEVISSWIYRHFDFFTPETHIVDLNGVRHSASRLLPEGRDTTFIHDAPNTQQMRLMRIVAAFLRDMDRMSARPINRVFADGSVAVYDFRGTLGSQTQGDFKPGPVFSGGIGSFKAPAPQEIYATERVGEIQVWNGEHPMKTLFDSYNVDQLPSRHPWRHLTVEDAKLAQEYFRTLDTEKITEVVSRARFTSLRDRNQMIESLRIRRNAFLEYLADYIGGQQPREKVPYWARVIPESPLTFEVRDNRPSQISQDIRSYLRSVQVPRGNIILFRGQEHLTPTVISPTGRERAQSGMTPYTPEQVNQILDSLLSSSKTSLNWSREKSNQYRGLIGGDLSGVSRWWDRANEADALAEYHSRSNGHPIMVSATRDLGVASRWVESNRFSTKYRYVYILSVPENQTLPVTRTLLAKHGTTRESEVAVIYDATPYVVAVYDTIELKFVKFR